MDDSADRFWESWWPRAQATGRFEVVGSAATGQRPGLLVDGGWLRLLGAGSDRLPTAEALATPDGLVIGVDVLGGIFALERGREDGGGQVRYWAPDALAWERLALDHEAFLTWLLGDGLTEFYAASRWCGWQPHTDRFGPADGVLVDPPLWSQDAEDIDDCTITVAPFEQVIAAAARGVEQAGGDRYPLTPAQWRAALAASSSS